MRMLSRIGLASLALLPLLAVPALAQNGSTAGALDLHPTFQAVGARLSYTGDANGNANAYLEWRAQGATSWTRGMFMTKIPNSRWAASVMWLQPDTPYEVRAVIQDPDGGSTSAIGPVRTRANPSSNVTGTTLWVDPNGNDANPGTSGSPLRTIQAGVDRANPGDQVRVRPGIYYQTVDVSRAGTSSAFIHLVADGPGTILDGSDPAHLNRTDWRNDGGGVYSIPFTAAVRLVAADSTQRLYHQASLSALQSNGNGVSQGWVVEGGRLYVKLEGGASPNGRAMHVARYNVGIMLDQNYWRVAGFEIRFFGNSTNASGIQLQSADYAWVSDNYVHTIGGRNIFLRTGVDYALIERNYVRDGRIGTWPWAACKAHDEEIQGLSHRGGRGVVIRFNTVRGLFDGIDTADYANDENGAADCDIHDNFVNAVGDDAFEPEEVAGINLRIWRNRADAVFSGISIAPNRSGPQYILYNTFTNYVTRGYKCSLSSTGQTWIMHNTFSTTSAAAAIHPTGPFANMHFRNNILTGNGTSSVSDDAGESGSGNDFDGDLCYSNTGTLFRWKGTNYPNLTVLRAATGFEMNGRSGDPMFVSAASGNYGLRLGSPAIDGAIRYPGINDNFKGGAPDMGAWEFDNGLDTTAPAAIRDLN